MYIHILTHVFPVISVCSCTWKVTEWKRDADHPLGAAPVESGIGRVGNAGMYQLRSRRKLFAISVFTSLS